MNKKEIKDSGQRREFDSGAVRDMGKGKGRYDLISPIATKELALYMEKGLEKYPERNWEKGIPMSSHLDSTQRHLNLFKEGVKDEDHLLAAYWNIHCMLHNREMIRRGRLRDCLFDLPNYTQEDGGEIIGEKKTKQNIILEGKSG